MSNDAFLISAVILVLIIAIWLFTQYFSINKQQIRRKSSKHIVDTTNLNATNNNTITESNSKLSQHAFDGVNQNPEHKANKNLFENII